MKSKYILLAGLAVAGWTSCNDYLEVDRPSKYTPEYVFSQKSEIEIALNEVYAQALVDNLYGKLYNSSFCLNSDVDVAIGSSSAHSHGAYARFDCDEQGGEILKFWSAAYSLIEMANRFVGYADEISIPLYGDEDATLMQWIGEAKCLRAMAYHDLVVMFGDVPFTFVPAAKRGEDNYIFPVVDRKAIQDSLIADLQAASTKMLSTTASSVTVERCSKEFAQGLIARIALTAGGYSLHPDASNPNSYGKMTRPADYKDYYTLAMNYADSVIQMGTHSLTLPYPTVFVNECNYQVVNDDDPIFEIPFGRQSTGSYGYQQGPEYASYEGNTVGRWGKCEGKIRLNAFYRFLFRDNDIRREFVNGMWYYTYKSLNNVMVDSIVIRNDYSVHNNKWSKLWTSEDRALGSDKEDKTGINYPYMRYADILLMYAEAANEINEGPTPKAVDCLTQVHSRAFANGDADFITEASASKEAFQKAVMDERKWEFAGENSRWRDLVRTNTYAEELVHSFLRYYAAGMAGESGYEEVLNAHDGNTFNYKPMTIYYHPYYITEGTAAQQLMAHRMFGKQLYGYTFDASYNVVTAYPNQSLPSLRIYNAYSRLAQPTTSQITLGGFSASGWNNAKFYDWYNDNSAQPNNQCKYSYLGYIRADDNGNLWVIRDGAQEAFSTIPSAEDLPVVRYILPYPNQVILRSAGAYKNQYGY